MTEQTFVHLLAILGTTLVIGAALVSVFRDSKLNKADKVLMTAFAFSCYFIVLFIVAYYHFLAVPGVIHD